MEGGQVAQVFLIIRSKIIFTPLKNKDIDLKNICGHPDKVTLSKVIFNLKSLLLLPGLQKGVWREETICSSPLILISCF